jgi:2-dehydro-3-deoxyphosphogluconate aldolase/(4S)-4-hydroxy-2-oxoglutarate aldolase
MTISLETKIGREIRASGLIAVLVIDRKKSAVPLARALVDGGVCMMELTLRTSEAIDALVRIRAEVPEMTAGVGTILTTEQLDRVIDADAAFGVSPGLNPRVISHAVDRGFPFAPGVCTPTDIERGVELGCRVLKYFPAETSGGLKHLESMGAPYAHLGLTYIPLGGVNTGNLAQYLNSPMICAVGGSWLAPRALIEAEKWDEIRGNAREAAELVARIRAGV